MNNIQKFQYRYSVLSKEPYSRYKTKNAIDPKQNSDELGEQFHGSYKALLFDSRWKNKRLDVLNRDQYKCVLCNSDSTLQVHHRQYHFVKETKEFKPPWDYENSLLITLCEKCHQKGHRQYKVPTIYI
jgi:hypothetical protein